MQGPRHPARMAKHRTRGSDRPAASPRGHGADPDPRRPTVRSATPPARRHGFAWEDVAGGDPAGLRARPAVQLPGRPTGPDRRCRPGVTVGFGVDARSGLHAVSTAHWRTGRSISPDLAERALAQPAPARPGRGRTRPPSRLDRRTCRSVVFQSRDGWASTTVLLPEEIDRLFGPWPALFVAPSRDLLIGLPGRRRPGVRDVADRGIRGGRSERAAARGLRVARRNVRCRPLARAAVAV